MMSLNISKYKSQLNINSIHINSINKKLTNKYYYNLDFIGIVINNYRSIKEIDIEIK